MSRGVISLLTLIVLTVGPPAALVALVGWPLPASTPTLTEIGDALRLGIGDAVVVKTLAVLAWLAWLQVAISILVEAAAALRGRASNRLPILPGVQASVGRLIAGVTLLGSTTLTGAHFPAGATTAPGADPVALVSSVPIPDTPIAVPVDDVGPPRPDEPAAQAIAPTIEVRPHDSYWAIAERIYGDGLRWREIRDANVGRTMTDGTVIESGSDMLMPGWILQLLPGTVPPASTAPAPAPAPTATAPEPPAPTPAPAEAIVTPGDSMWQLAEEHLRSSLGRPPTDEETAAYCGPFIEANRDRLVDPANADLIFPGQTFLLPLEGAGTPPPPATNPSEPPPPERTPQRRPTPAPVDPDPVVPTGPPSTEVSPTATAATTPTTQAEPMTTPATDAPPTSIPPAEDGGHEGDQSDFAAVALAAIASTALAVGITREVRRRRRRRNHQSPRTVPLPPPDEPFHRKLIAAADEDSVDLLASAMADLAGQLATSGQGGRPRIVQHGPDHIDVFLDRPTSPALGRWSAAAEGQIWTLRTAGAEAGVDGARRWMTPAPLLVSLGRPDEGGQLYIDLETAAVTTLTGDPVVALDLLRTIAAEVAHSPFGDATQVLVVGELGSPSLVDASEQVTVIDSWESVVVDLAHWASQSRSALEHTGHTDPFTARAEEPQDDALLPLLVIATDPPESHESLAFLHGTPAATAVVVVADTALPGSTVIECAADVLHLPRFGLSCAPQALDQESAAKVAELLRAASDPAGTELALSLDVVSGGNGAEPDTGPAPVEYRDAEYDILVRFLGDIAVEGDLRRRLVGKEVAAVSYIALHRSVTIDRVEDALWAAPSTETRRERLFHIMSKCRSAVGPDRLPTADDGRYAVGPTVRTDLELFDARVAAAATEPRQHVSADLLLSALRLCTGQVFHHQSRDRDSFGWIEAANLVGHWEPKITELAEALTERCLELGDTRSAIEASEAGLRVLPIHSGCTEALMRAHAAAGNREAVQRVYQTHVAALELIHLDQVADSTAELYEQLQSAG